MNIPVRSHPASLSRMPPNVVRITSISHRCSVEPRQVAASVAANSAQPAAKKAQGGDGEGGAPPPPPTMSAVLPCEAGEPD
jgi:hypothetical protein